MRPNQNKPKVQNSQTFEGAPASHEDNLAKLRRVLFTSMLFENNFYMDGKQSSDLLRELVLSVNPNDAFNEIVKARKAHGIRHAPLFAIAVLASVDKNRNVLRELVRSVIHRVDETADLIALLWQESGKRHIPHQVRKGLSDALNNFSEYQFAKYKMERRLIKLVDVFNLVHPKPKNREKSELFKKVVSGSLDIPDTWEVRISAVPKENKDARRAVWIDLIKSQKLSTLATIRNLRNMIADGVPDDVIYRHIDNLNFWGVFPHQVITASFECGRSNIGDYLLDKAMMFWAIDAKKMNGKTAILVDVSGSMGEKISKRSDAIRADAAAGLAVSAELWFSDFVIVLFNHDVRKTEKSRLFLLDEIRRSVGGGTRAGQAAQYVMRYINPERMIFITDEQSADVVEYTAPKTYIMNVAPYEFGVQVKGNVHRISGFCPELFRYIAGIED